MLKTSSENISGFKLNTVVQRRNVTPNCTQLFYSFFKTLVGKEIAVELKNDVALTGTLHSVDQYLNVKLTDVQVVDAERYPQLVRLIRSTLHVHVCAVCGAGTLIWFDSLATLLLYQ